MTKNGNSVEATRCKQRTQNKPSLKWWIKNSPRFLCFCFGESIRIIGKFIIWILIIGLVITLTSISDAGWQELANVLFGNLTLVGVIRDILLVLLGVGMGCSFSKTMKHRKKKYQWRETRNTQKGEQKLVDSSIKWELLGEESGSEICRSEPPFFFAFKRTKIIIKNQCKYWH